MLKPSDTTIEQLVGLTLVEITGMEQRSSAVEFTSACGRAFRMFHEQDCCEDVELNEVIGYPEALLGSPIISARVDSNRGQNDDGTFTWTFYHLQTVKGIVTLRWYGSSNGYYSENVDFVEMKEAA